MQEPSPNSGTDHPSDEALSDLRRRIDELDSRLIELLNERARVVQDVGKVKQGTNIPIYAPHRESQVLKKVLGLSEGPLPARSIEGIYRELMSGSFALEQPLRIGYLGPAGSFSHQASLLHFGSSVEFDDLHTIESVFTEVARGHVDYGLVPIENSTIGGVVETLDAFIKFAGDVNIYAEVLISVEQNLLANCPPDQIKVIYSKPEVFPQCRHWLATNFPQARQIPVASTSQAVKDTHAQHEADPSSGAAAIASSLAGELYGVKTLFENIADNINNITRFFVLARQEAQPTGNDKTSIVFQTSDTPGALSRVLVEFDIAQVNLTHIDKRPSGRENWHYTFFVDAQGHKDDDRVQRAIAGARTHCETLTVLGSYPMAERIL
ncbi:MAG: prephenate dehydratase [Planctomycetota bacterium]|jgi:chorismate mutase/prephenate dehydratase